MVEVAGVLLVQNGEYVVQKRDHIPGIAHPGQLAPWGGLVEGDESPKQGAVRELLEETGVAVSEEDLNFLTKLSIKAESIRSKGQMVDVYLYSVEIAADVPVVCNEGEKLVRIKGVQDIRDDEREGYLIAAIEAYEQQESQSK